MSGRLAAAGRVEPRWQGDAPLKGEFQKTPLSGLAQAPLTPVVDCRLAHAQAAGNGSDAAEQGYKLLELIFRHSGASGGARHDLPLIYLTDGEALSSRMMAHGKFQSTGFQKARKISV